VAERARNDEEKAIVIGVAALAERCRAGAHLGTRGWSYCVWFGGLNGFSVLGARTARSRCATTLKPPRGWNASGDTSPGRSLLGPTTRRSPL
jgi:hypothetical protein